MAPMDSEALGRLAATVEAHGLRLSTLETDVKKGFEVLHGRINGVYKLMITNLLGLVLAIALIVFRKALGLG